MVSSIQDLIKQSWPVYKSNLKKLIGMILIPVIAVIPLMALFLLLIFLKSLFSGNDMAISVINILFGLIGFAGMICFIFIVVIAQAGLYVLIKDSKENITIKEAFLRAKKIAFKFFTLNLLIGIFVFLWSLLFVIPGIYMAIAYSMAIWIFIYENISGTAAIKKSKELVKGYWWAVVGRLAGVYLLFYLVLAIPGMFLGDNGLGMLWGFAAQIISFLATPFFMIYQCFMYWDLKKIKSGYVNDANK